MNAVNMADNDLAAIRRFFNESERLNLMYPIDANYQLCEFAAGMLYQIIKNATNDDFKNKVKDNAHGSFEALKNLTPTYMGEIFELVLSLPVEQYYQLILYIGKSNSALFDFLLFISQGEE